MISGLERAPTLGQDIVILVPLASYPLIDFVFCIANGIVAPDLSGEFSLDAADLGQVSSVFFIAFGLAQLPHGIAYRILAAGARHSQCLGRHCDITWL